MWSVFPVAQGYGIPAVVHSQDRALLSDPTRAMSAQLRQSLPEMLGTHDIFAEPDEVLTASDGQTLHLGEFHVAIRHAPGHTPGSLLYDFGNTVFTGDVLFAGAIGRTDLPGGSPEAMDRSLRDVVLRLDDSCNIYPGHGPQTTMADERVSNPYLVRIAQGLSAQ
jgi:glyoxylase-like metal-dependent hydrolase (beta-lactamase superfamily II)